MKIDLARLQTLICNEIVVFWAGVCANICDDLNLYVHGGLRAWLADE